MTEPLILLFVGIGIAVLIGVLVVAVMVRTRRPGGGIRNWIRESADSWQENDYRSRGEHNGERVRLVGAIRARRAEKESSRANGAANLPAADEVPTGQLPPTFAPARRRRLAKNVEVSVTKDPEDTTSYLPVVPSGASVITPLDTQQQAESAATNQASESAKSEPEDFGQESFEPESSEPATPIRRWARQFTPDPAESETPEDENDLPPEDSFQVDKITWQRVHAE